MISVEHRLPEEDLEVLEGELVDVHGAIVAAAPVEPEALRGQHERAVGDALSRLVRTPVVQAAAAATAGVLAGAATLTLLRRLGESRMASAAALSRLEPPVAPAAGDRPVTYIVQIWPLHG